MHRFWAAAVVAGPGEKPPTVAPADDTLSADLLAGSAAATQELIAALRAAGPAAGCWTWWGDSDVPMTSGAVARHQVREAAVHAFDAQLATGTPLPIPAVVALDGIAEFIGVGHGTAGPWPHEPVRIGLHAAEGESWLVDLTASGSHVIDGQHETAADLHGSVSNLLLTLHGRLPLDSLRSEGDRAALENFLRWPDLPAREPPTGRGLRSDLRPPPARSRTTAGVLRTWTSPATPRRMTLRSSLAGRQTCRSGVFFGSSCRVRVGSSATCSGRVLADPMLTFLMVHQLGRVAVARCGEQALPSVDEMGEQGPTPRARVRVDAAGECLDAGCRSGTRVDKPPSVSARSRRAADELFRASVGRVD
ncbi:maleylpyruvate isomerase N-terminal domain-containing protein [Streptomyces inhibens]|uniref:maleylpyruvate isomerase N-terminal domain-containing protein n=1 Tax=Streptomyces inhibens TaxID=2293571 RepID=UPI00402AF687